MGGERVTREEWLRIAAPLVAVIGVLMACISYGFATEKAWSRHVVIAMFALELFSFAMQLFVRSELSANIANTAHIIGGLVGLALGRLPLFTRKPA